MKNIFLAISLLFTVATYADQPQVASKIYSGNGQTAITATGTSLNSNVTNTVTVTGTVTATNASVSTTGTAVPASATFVGGSDGTNLRALKTSATGVVSVDGSASTQPISAASLPLPTGAATAAKQPALGTAGTPSVDVLTVQGIASMTAFKVDGSAVTQPVSGTFWQATQPVSAASLPLPSGASTAANQTSVQGSVSGGTAATNSLLTGGQYNSTPPTLTNGQQAALQLDSSGSLKTAVSFPGSIAVTQSTSPWIVDGSGVTQPVSGTFWQATQPVSAAALPLPTGAATSANQTSIQGSASGGTAAANSVLTGGIYNSTPPTLTNGQQASFQFDSSGSLKTAVSFPGSIAVTQSTSPWVVDGSGFTQPVSGTFWQATQPVSAAALPLPTGASTSAKQPALGTAGSASADVITVQGIASMTALKVDGSAVTQPVSGTFWQATQPVSAATLPLPTGASTSANQTSVQGSPSGGTAAANSVLAGGIYNSTPPTLTDGQQASLQFDSSGSLKTTANFAGTVAVTQSTSPWVVDGSGVTQPISAAALPLPSGAATSAKQPAIGTAGTASADVLTVQGIASMTALTVDGSAVTQPISASALPLPSGASTAAKQPALGTAGSASADVITIQGIASMTALKVDGSAVTQPISGTVTANAGIGNFTVVQATGSNLHVAVDSAPTTAVTQSGTWNVNATPVVPTATTVKQAAVTIGTSAVRLTTDGSAPSSTRTLLVAQLLSTSTANCYFGSSGVTSSGATRGVQMFAGQSFSFNNDAGDYYAICDTTAQTFFITEQE